MSDTSSTDGPTASTEPTEDPTTDLAALDPAEFVGEPPAGDDSPGEFMSQDQQPDRPTGAHTRTDASEEDDA